MITPEDFNKSHPPPTSAKKAKQWGFLAAGLLAYLLIVFLPAWLLLRKLSNKFAVSVNLKRVAFALLSAALLFPMPIPMSMFGPMLLVPGAFLAPSVASLPQQYFHYAAISFSAAFLLSVIASIRYIRKYS